MATIYARLKRQNKFKYLILISASFSKFNEEDQRDNEIELIIIFNNNHKLTKTDIDNIDVKSQLEHQIQIQKTKESGEIFDEIILLEIGFYKTGE